jgi:predicted dehydrogenase
MTAAGRGDSQAGTVRFGLIGSGAITTLSHLPALARIPEARLVATADVDGERAARVAAEGGAEEVYTDFRDLVQSPNVDAVIVAIPNVYHRDAVVAAAEAGKHVFCEKPLATNLRDAREMIAACEAANVKLMVGFNQRFWNQVDVAKEIIDSGALGEIKGFRSVYSEDWDVYPAATRYRYDLAQSGGACIIDLTIHRIDLARYLLGEITSLCAEIKHSVIPPKVDDNVWLLCNFANGATGCISSDRFSPMVANATDVFGTEGTLYLSSETFNPFQSVPLAVYTEKPLDQVPQVITDYIYPTAWWEKPKNEWVSIVPPRDSAYVKELTAFCASIRNDTPPPVTGEDGYKSLEIVLAAYLSVRERRWVDLPLTVDEVAPPDFE